VPTDIQRKVASYGIGVKLLVEALFEGLTSPTYQGSSAKEARLLLTRYEAGVR